MKRIFSVLLLLLVFLATVIMLTHYFPEKVPKQIATALPGAYYKALPRQVREYFPWLKPKEPDKPFTFKLEEINKQIDDFNVKQKNSKSKKSQNTLEALQSIVDDFYQKLAEGQTDNAFELMHSVSQNSFSGEFFTNYYSMTKNTFEVQKATVDKNLVTIPKYKEPITGKVISPLIKAKVTFKVNDNFSDMKSIAETTTRNMYFAQESGEWKIVELDLNSKNYKEKQFYYFVDEAYKRLNNSDTFGAIDFFRKAVSVNNLSINAYYGLSAALYTIAYYDKTIETVQHMESIYHKKYVTKLIVDNVDLKTIKSLDTDRLSNGYYVMACALIKKGNLPAAKNTLYKSLSLRPNNAYALAALKTIPRKIAAKPAPQLYIDEGERLDPFKQFRESASSGSSQPEVMAIDPKNAVNLLDNK